MTLVVICSALLAAGFAMGRWWVLSVPILLALGLAVAGGLAGQLSLRDNPLPFLLILTEAVVAFGVFSRRVAHS